MKIKKQHMVLATLVLILSASVYINWRINPKGEVEVRNTTRELGAATYVNSDISTYDEVQVSAENSGLSVSQAEYFADAESERQRTQDELIALAREVLELSDSDEDANILATEQLNYLENMILSQSRIEATLKAKGFSDCLCYLDDVSCTVIVPENEMKENSSLIIRECVSSCSGIDFQSISIVEV